MAIQTIYPVLKYEDAHAGMDFLERAFGFERHAVYDGENGGVGHAELKLGDQYVMLSSTNEGDERFNQGAGRYSLYVVVDNPDAHFTRARKPARTSSASSPTRTTDHASTRPATRRATSGASGPTGRANSSGEGAVFLRPSCFTGT
jgi:uncharacterized glyoxalase superfamily protein PhnB